MTRSEEHNETKRSLMNKYNDLFFEVNVEGDLSDLSLDAILLVTI